MKTPICRVLVVLGLAGSLPAAAITIDGNAVDWATAVASTKRLPTGGIGSGDSLELQTGSAELSSASAWRARVQDAEALYATEVGRILFIALLTGHSQLKLPQSITTRYGADGFAVDLARDSSFELALHIKSTQSFSRASGELHATFGVAGGEYGDAVWAYGR